MSESTIEKTISRTDADSFRLDWITWLLLLVLGTFVVGAFWPTVKASFVDLDDEAYVFGNSQVLRGLSLHTIKWALTTHTGGFYMPTTWLSLELDSTIAEKLRGEKAELEVHDGKYQLPDATVYHVTNVVLHMIAAWILFLFLYRATRWRWASFAVALLWAVHPLRVESVAWVTERKDEIAGVFGFLAMYFYVVAIEKTSRARGGWYWAACAALVLSLGGKAMFVTMPVLLLIVDVWPLRRIKNFNDLKRASSEKWTMWLIVIICAAATFWLGRSNGTLRISEMEKVENGFLSYIRYLILHVDFQNLAPFYPYLGSPIIYACGAFAIMTLVTAAAIWQRKRCPWLFTGWVWYVAAFLPMIGFVQNATQAYADRFSYLPSVGIVIVVVFGLFQWRRGTAVLVAGMLVVGTLLAAFSYRQSLYWHDSITLFERAREVTTSNKPLHRALGRAYVRAGQFEKAEREFQTVIKIDPEFWGAHMWLASIYMQTRRLELAMSEAKTAVEMAPDEFEPHKLYGSLMFLNEHYSEANDEFEKALSIDSEDQEVRSQLQVIHDKIAARGR